MATLKGADGWVLTLHRWSSGARRLGDREQERARRSVRRRRRQNGVFTDSAVQEYDLRTGKLLYSWSAAQHIPRHDSYTQPPPNGFPWDTYHVNSVEPYGNGTFLVSMRNTWAIYLVSARTGPRFHRHREYGCHMARHLIEAGYPLTVHDARRATGPLIELGAVWADSPAEVAKASEVVFTSLPGPRWTAWRSARAASWLPSIRHGLRRPLDQRPTSIRKIHAAGAERGVQVLERAGLGWRSRRRGPAGWR